MDALGIEVPTKSSEKHRGRHKAQVQFASPEVGQSSDADVSFKEYVNLMAEKAQNEGKAEDIYIYLSYFVVTFVVAGHYAAFFR